MAVHAFTPRDIPDDITRRKLNEVVEVVADDWSYAVVNLATDSTTIYTGPALVGEIWVDTVMSAHACPVKDGSTTVWNIPASSAAGTIFNWHKGIRHVTSLIIDPDNSATGTIVVKWRKI